MASKVSNVILCLLCLLFFVGPSSSLLETLVQIRMGSQGELTTEGYVLADDCKSNPEKPCVAQEIPDCRNSTFPSEYFRQYYFDPTLTKDGFKFNEGENLTIMDCEAKCFNNCSCVAYASTNLDFQTGCQIWSTRPSTATNYSEGDDMYKVIHLLEIQDGRRRLTSDGSDNQVMWTRTWANRWWIWLIVAIVGIIITSSCCLFFNERLMKKEERIRKAQKMLLLELGANAIHSTVHDKVKKLNNDRQGSHDLQIFSFESVSAATSNFSAENKLGHRVVLDQFISGYMSPEYAMNGVVSVKTDVFSYGILLLEIMSGKKNNSRYHFDHSLNLIGYAWQLWNEGKGLELIDPIILDESRPPTELLRCIHIGLLCVQDQAKDRPSMLEVVSMLSNEALQLCPPKQPAFFINSVQEESSEDSEIKLEICSINNVTISDMEAR